MMLSAIAHHPLIDAQLVPERRFPLSLLPPVHILGMMSHGMEYTFGQFGSAALTVSPPSFLCTPNLCWQGSMKC